MQMNVHGGDWNVYSDLYTVLIKLLCSITLVFIYCLLTIFPRPFDQVNSLKITLEPVTPVLEPWGRRAMCYGPFRNAPVIVLPGFFFYHGPDFIPAYETVSFPEFGLLIWYFTSFP